MGTELHLPELRRLLVDFHMLTGQRIGIFDSDFRLIMEYPKQHGAFCTPDPQHSGWTQAL